MCLFSLDFQLKFLNFLVVFYPSQKGQILFGLESAQVFSCKLVCVVVRCGRWSGRLEGLRRGPLAVL